MCKPSAVVRYSAHLNPDKVQYASIRVVAIWLYSWERAMLSTRAPTKRRVLAMSQEVHCSIAHEAAARLQCKIYCARLSVYLNWFQRRTNQHPAADASGSHICKKGFCLQEPFLYAGGISLIWRRIFLILRRNFPHELSLWTFQIFLIFRMKFPNFPNLPFHQCYGVHGTLTM